MSLLAYVLQDRRANPRDPKAQLVLAAFRAAQMGRPRVRRFPPLIVILILYRVCVEWILGIELPWKTKVGPRLRLYHGVGLVVNDGSRIGADVVLRHGVTVGHLEQGGGCPTICDRVNVGANAIVLGPVTIGADAIIGAGAVVTKDVEAGQTVVGNPARALGRRTRDE